MRAVWCPLPSAHGFDADWCWQSNGMPNSRLQAKAVKMTPRTKHIAVKYFFFKSHIGEGTGIELVKVDTLLQKADIFTKGMAPEKFVTMRMLLCGW